MGNRHRKENSANEDEKEKQGNLAFVEEFGRYDTQNTECKERNDINILGKLNFSIATNVPQRH